jgi:hypothetical protein
MSAPAFKKGGVVACGYEDGRRGKIVRGSEVQVFRCGHSEDLLYFDGTQTATIEPAGDALRIVEYSRWPFGKHWKWIEVPVVEWRIDSRSSNHPSGRPRLRKPELTTVEIKQFLREYRARVAMSDHRGGGEESVGRMFAAMVSGDPEAIRLFASMRSDAGLDGAAAEDYEYAVHDYRLGKKQEASR